MSILFDHDHGPFLEDARTVRQDGGQAFQHMHGTSVVEAEDDHARFPATRERRDLAEVQIEGEDDPALRDRLREDLAVRQALEALVAEMDGVVPVLAQPSGNTASTPMSRRNFKRRPPSGQPMWTCSWASQAAYPRACSMSSRSRSGYPASTSSKVAP